MKKRERGCGARDTCHNKEENRLGGKKNVGSVPTSAKVEKKEAIILDEEGIAKRSS